MLFREHRGSLDETMETVVELDPTLEALIAHIGKLFMEEDLHPISKIEVKYYGYDARIGWETYIVTSKGWGVIGFTNQLPI